MTDVNDMNANVDAGANANVEQTDAAEVVEIRESVEEVKQDETSVEDAPVEQTEVIPVEDSSVGEVKTAPVEQADETPVEVVEATRVETVSAETTAIAKVTLDDGSGNEVVLIDVSKFSLKDLVWAKTEAKELDWGDSNAVMIFGQVSQIELGNFLDTLLDDIKPKDVGEDVQNLSISLAKGIEITKIKEFQKQMKSGRGVLAKIPFFGSFFDYAKIFLAKQQDFKSLIEDILKKCLERQKNLIRRNTEMDAMYEANERCQLEMAKWIIAAEEAILIGEAKFAEFNRIADETKDPQDAENARDFSEQLTAFETRVMDMKVAYMRAMVAGPQIRIVQQTTKINLGNIQRTMTSELPALKGAIVMAAANYSNIQAQAERETTRQAVKDIENLNADTMGQGYLSAKRSQGQDALDDAMHIADIANSLLETMREGVQIDQENVQKRKEAEQYLVGAKGSLTEGLRQVQELQRTSVA